MIKGLLIALAISGVVVSTVYFNADNYAVRQSSEIGLDTCKNMIYDATRD